MLRRVCGVLLGPNTGGNSAGSKVINHYARLGIALEVAAAASPADLKTAYRKRALECHPDVAPTPEDRSAFEVQFRHLAESYELLSNPEARRQLNKDLLVAVNRKRSSTAQQQRSSSSSSMETSSSFMSSWSTPTPSNRTRTRGSAAGVSMNDQAGNGNGGGIAPNAAYNAIREKLIKRREDEKAIEKELFKRYTDAHHKKHKRFLQRDADRVFKTAFDGKTWDQVLFDLERERRSGAAAAGRTPSSQQTASPTSSSSSEKSSSTVDTSGFSQAATRAVARRLRDRIERGGGSTHGARRIMMNRGPIAMAAFRGAGMAATAAEHDQEGNGRALHMPFRPFPMPLSKDAPIELTADVVVPNLSEGTITDSSSIEGPVKRRGHVSRVQDVANKFVATKRGEQERNNPYNQGQLYSYQRPY